jgi:hypothetical protein
MASIVGSLPRLPLKWFDALLGWVSTGGIGFGMASVASLPAAAQWVRLVLRTQMVSVLWQESPIGPLGKVERAAAAFARRRKVDVCCGPSVLRAPLHPRAGCCIMKVR